MVSSDAEGWQEMKVFRTYMLAMKYLLKGNRWRYSIAYDREIVWWEADYDIRLYGFCVLLGFISIFFGACFIYSWAIG